MFAQETFDLALVFLRQDAAGGINEAALWFDQFCGGIEDAVLLFGKFGQCFGRLAVFEVGIAAQCAEAGAGRVHQNAVGLAFQTA